MLILSSLFLKILPLYFIIFLGYLAGKKLNVSRDSVASLLIFFIAPLVVFTGVITTKLNFATLSLPVLFFILCSTLSFLFFFFSRKVWIGGERNILAFSAGTGNTGYFGLPVILSLFGEQYLGIAVLSILGFVLYENSVGYFMIARGRYTAKDALIKVLKLPTIYAFIFGIILSVYHFSPSPSFLELLSYFKGSYVVLGMMLVGIGLSTIKKGDFDLKLISLSFFAKFIVWPVIIFVIIYLDKSFFHVYENGVHNVMLLLSIVPLASNTVAYSSQLGINPEKASITVLLSTLFALIYIPIFVLLFIS